VVVAARAAALERAGLTRTIVNRRVNQRRLGALLLRRIVHNGRVSNCAWSRVQSNSPGA